MSVFEVNNVKTIEKLFEGWEETLIWSCLDGSMGKAFSDNPENPQSAQIIIGDFCFFAGKPNKELIENFPKDYKSAYLIMIGRDEEHNKLIEKIYKEKANKVSRYAIKKEYDVFDKDKLQRIINNLDKNIELRLIDEEIYNELRKNQWSKDLCSQFNNYEDYKNRGIGVAAIVDGLVVSGASSYTVYKKGIEIEIDTREDYRRRGLALACGAMLILECLKRGLYPSWDAQNKGSVALSEKLGYHFDKEYTAYEVKH